MNIFVLLALVYGVLGLIVVIARWLRWRHRRRQSPPQSITMTAKRHAELLEQERREER